VILNFIKTLSLNSARRYLIEEGYTEEECIERCSEVYDRVFIYPYSLYNEKNQLIDRLGHFEYGVFEENGGDDFDIVKMEWRRF